MEKGKGIQNTLIIVLAIVIIAMSVGYALSDIELSINTTGKFREIKWSVIWDESTYTEESTDPKAITTTMTDRVSTSFNEDSTVLTTSVRLDNPGEFYEFTINAKNDGDIDALCNSITITGTSDKFVSYTVIYNDEPYTASATAYETTYELDAGESVPVTVRVEYVLPDDEEDLPVGTETIGDYKYQNVELSAAFNYVQNDNND